MRMAVEKMISKMIGVGALVALGVVSGVAGLMASEYEFAPPEALQMAEDLDPSQSFQAPGESGFSMSEDYGPIEDASNRPCCAKCGRGSCCPPDWYWEQNLRVLSRSRVRPIPLSLIQLGIPSNPAGTVEYWTYPLMTNKSLSFDIAGGYDTTVGHYLGRDAENRDQFVEFSFWGMNVWNENRRVNGRLTPQYNSGGTQVSTAGRTFFPLPQQCGRFQPSRKPLRLLQFGYQQLRAERPDPTPRASRPFGPQTEREVATGVPAGEDPLIPDWISLPLAGRDLRILWPRGQS